MTYDPAEKFHSLRSEHVTHALHTSSHGLSENEARKRQKLYGKNAFQEEEDSLLRIFLRQFNSPLIFILFAAALISLLLREYIDFYVIFGIIVINGILGFWQEVKAATSLLALKKLTETKNKVLRDGTMQLIPSSNLVPGDCLVFHQGEVITADVRLLESASLMVDEATLTGESVPAEKITDPVAEKSTVGDRECMAFSGTMVVSGRATGIVVARGPAIVSRAALAYDATVDDGAKITTKIGQLAAAGIIARDGV